MSSRLNVSNGQRAEGRGKQNYEERPETDAFPACPVVSAGIFYSPAWKRVWLLCRPARKHNTEKAILSPARGPRKCASARKGSLFFLSSPLSLLLGPTCCLCGWATTWQLYRILKLQKEHVSNQNTRGENSDLKSLSPVEPLFKTKFIMNTISATQNYTAAQLYVSGRNSISNPQK